jgi:alkaline phosphatase D
MRSAIPRLEKVANRYDQAHEKGSGFALFPFDPVKTTYAIDSFRFLIDPAAGKASNQFPGWPVTIHQAENWGENRID